MHSIFDVTWGATATERDNTNRGKNRDISMAATQTSDGAAPLSTATTDGSCQPSSLLRGTLFGLLLVSPFWVIVALVAWRLS